MKRCVLGRNDVASKVSKSKFALEQHSNARARKEADLLSHREAETRLFKRSSVPDGSLLRLAQIEQSGTLHVELSTRLSKAESGGKCSESLRTS